MYCTDRILHLSYNCIYLNFYLHTWDRTLCASHILYVHMHDLKAKHNATASRSIERPRSPRRPAKTPLSYPLCERQMYRRTACSQSSLAVGGLHIRSLSGIRLPASCFLLPVLPDLFPVLHSFPHPPPPHGKCTPLTISLLRAPLL